MTFILQLAHVYMP